MLDGFFDFTHHDACERRRDRLKFFDFQTCHRQGVSQGLGRNGRVAKFAQPRFWELHQRFSCRYGLRCAELLELAQEANIAIKEQT